MEKVITIDIMSENDLFEKYNKNKLANEMIEYIIREFSIPLKDDTVKIIVNNHLQNNIEVTKFIKENLSTEYKKTINKNKHNFYIQLLYFFVGMLALFLSSLLKETLFKEIVLISGWVLIWSMIEIEMFSDTELKRRKRILYKALNSEIIENKNN